MKYFSKRNYKTKVMKYFRKRNNKTLKLCKRNTQCVSDKSVFTEKL